MKRVSLIVGLAIAIAFTACEKAEVTPANVKSTNQDKVVFENATEEESEMLNAMLNGTDNSQTAPAPSKSSAEAVGCCGVSVLAYNPTPSGYPNLNVQFKVESSTQELYMKHWRQVGNTYIDLGETTSSGFTGICQLKNINVGDPAFAPSGVYISLARIREGSSFCGPAGFIQWSH